MNTARFRDFRLTASLTKYLSIILVICLLLVSVVPPAARADTSLNSQNVSDDIRLNPPAVNVTLQPGETYPFSITLETPAVPIPKVDVLFLFDITGSMKDEIDEAKTHGMHIMRSLRRLVPDSSFGVAALCDYPGHFISPGYEGEYGGASDVPWTLVQDLTDDVNLVADGIRRLALCNGEDGPEAYSRALFEAMYDVTWRMGAKHVMVLFGDAPAHDPDFYIPFGGQNYGVDPGVDEQIGTDDDLRLRDVVEQVKQRGVVIIPVSSVNLAVVNAGFEYMASQTGGKAYRLEEAEQLTATVTEGLQHSVSVISSLVTQVPFEYAGWVSIFPNKLENVGGGEQHTLKVVLIVPVDAEFGEHQFPIQFVGDGALLGEVQVTVLVPVQIALPKPAELLDQKNKLITGLSQPHFSIEMFHLPGTITLTQSYAQEEAPVKQWIDSVNPSTVTPSTLGALFSLTKYEYALERLLYARVRAGNMVGQQIAHSAGMVISVISAWRVLHTLGTKLLVGKLVAKLNYYVESKLVQMLKGLLDWYISALPSDRRTGLMVIISQALDVASKRIENALRTSTGAGATLGSFIIELFLQYLIHPITIGFGDDFVNSTKPFVSTAFAYAQRAGTLSESEESVNRRVYQVETATSALISEVESEVNSLSAEHKQLEDKHHLFEQLSEGIAGIGVAITLTGAGAIIGQISHVIAIALKVIDLILSADFGIRCTVFAFTLDDIAKGRALNAAFGIHTVRVPAEPLLPAIFTGRCCDSLVSKAETSSARTRIPRQLTPEHVQLITLLQTQESELDSFLTQLADAVSRSDVSGAETLADRILQLDEQMAGSLHKAHQPIFASVPTWYASNWEEVWPLYRDFGRSLMYTEGQGASFFLYLLGWLNDPDNQELKTRLIGQIDAYRQSIATHRTALEQLLPYTTDVASLPNTVIVGFQLPAELYVDRPAELLINVVNSSGREAVGINVRLDMGASAEVRSSPTVRLERLPAGEQSQVAFTVVPKAEAGFFTVISEVDNGVGDVFMGNFWASTSSSPPPPDFPPSGGGAVAFLILGLVIVIGTFLVTYSSRSAKSKTPLRQDKRAAGTFAWLWDPSLHIGQPIQPGSRVGRSQDCEIRLLDPTVSRYHAVILYTQGVWYVQDLNSVNGTWVNGRRIQMSPLRDGDTLQFGAKRFIFRLPETYAGNPRGRG